MDVKLPKNLGIYLLAVWLVLWGLFGLLNFRFTGQDLLMQLLAIVAGVVLFLQHR